MSDVNKFEVVKIPQLSSPRNSPLNPSKRKPRKPVSRRSRLTRPKQRGLYKSKKRASPENSFVCTEDDLLHQQVHTMAAEPHENPLPCTQEARTDDSDNEICSEQFGDGINEPPILDNATWETPSLELISEVRQRFQQLLPENWLVIADQEGIHTLLISQCPTKAIQREIYLKYNGEVCVIVHCVTLPEENPVIKLSPNPLILSQESIEQFCARGLTLSKGILQFKVCPGTVNPEFQDLWHQIPDTYVDLNPYLEDAYQASCRSVKCSRIIPLDRKFMRCKPCFKVFKILKDRNKFNQEEDFGKTTPNVYLSTSKAQAKLKHQHEDIRKLEKRLSYYESKVEAMLDKEGVDLDENLSKDFQSLLEKADLSETQKLFLEEQLNASGKADPRAHRWHPSMIRLAIHLKSISASGYAALRDSGFVKLPSERTLYDYTHYIKTEDGVNKGLLEELSKNVSAKKFGYQKFHSLIFDEMHISQNLVYCKSTGNLVGYVHLDEVDKEMQHFENFLKGVEEVENPPLATKILAFMVKGITTDVKSVIASYPCKEMSKDMLYARTWDVISQLEGAGVKIISLVCDGSAVNRAFFKEHTPITKTKSGIVFDTLNLCSEDERTLYFIADVAHLIKTMRNCFYKSREGKKSYRNLTINGQKLMWKTIVKLYQKFQHDTLRKSHKLNAQNVFLNSYSCMKVSYAAQIFSDTVANDIASQRWPGTEELVKFLKYGNKFFDCLNGAHSSQAIKQLKPDLAPYTEVDDERFTWLDSYLEYLENWKQQSESLNMPPSERAKTMLSYQTLEGIEIAIKGFNGAVRYLLGKANAKFIMARAFSQDPLEHHFSRQRASTGGSTNPNVQQFQRSQVAIAIQGQIKMSRRRANVEDDPTESIVCSAPLPKRPRKASSKH